MAWQLILQFRDRSLEDADEVAEFEDALFEMLDGNEALDGHAIGPAARDVFVVTDDPAATFARVLPFLDRAGLAGSMRAAFRREGEDVITPHWPPGRSDPFSPA